MKESILLIKSKKRILLVALISLLLIGIATVINLSGKNEQINKITKDLIGNTYKETYSSIYIAGEDKLTFYEDNKVHLERDCIVYRDDSSEHSVGDAYHPYSVDVSVLGTATVVIIPDGAKPWSPLPVAYDEKGIAQLGDDYIIQNRAISGQVATKPSAMGVIWILVLLSGIIATTVTFILHWRILRSIKKTEEEAKKRAVEAERSAAIAKENNRRNTIKAFWDDALSALGYEENEAIFPNGDLMWIANRCLYQTKPFDDYLKSYDQETDANQLVKIALSHIAIPVERIQYYAKEGDVQYTTKISGGGGGGYSIAGAIVGGIIAGDTGAIIGSRQKINDVTSETETHDSRRTILRYYKGNSLEIMSFDGFAVYDFLLGKIPEKDLLTMQLQKSNTPVKVESISSVKEKLQALRSMHDDGLINDSDYEEKKNQLLQKL